MKTIEFRGYSDDTFGWYPMGSEADGDDHDDCATFTVRTYVVEHESQRMAVTGVYGTGCMWSVGIAPMDDDEPLPDWPMRWRFTDYSAVLSLTVPDDATVTLVHPKGDG